MLALPIQQESRFDPTEVLRRAHTGRLRIIPRYLANWSGAADGWRGDLIHLVQEKTGKALAIPIHPVLDPVSEMKADLLCSI